MAVTVLVVQTGEACATPCTTFFGNGSNNVNAVAALLACRETDTLCCYTVNYSVSFDQRRSSTDFRSGCWDSEGTPLMNSFNGFVTMPAYSPCYYESDAVAAEASECSMVLIPADANTFSSLNFSGTLHKYTKSFNPNGTSSPTPAHTCLAVVLALALTIIVSTV